MPHRIDHHKLLAALTNLPHVRKNALRSLPEILQGHGLGHTTISVPEGDHFRIFATSDPAFPVGTRVPEQGIITECARTRRSIYLTNAIDDDRYKPMGGKPLPVELALPIFEREHLVAVLNIERSTPLSDREREALTLFVNDVSEKFTERSQAFEAQVISTISTNLAPCSTIEEAAEKAVHLVPPVLDLRAAIILSEHDGNLHRVAAQDEGLTSEEQVALERGVPYPHGLGWKACLTGETQYTSNFDTSKDAYQVIDATFGPVAIVHPISQHGDNRMVLALHFEAGSHISHADVTIVQSACRQLAIVFDNIRARLLQDKLLTLHTRVAEETTLDLYQHILATAIATVPGAEAGTLLVRRASSEPFRFKAAIGYDMTALDAVHLDHAHVATWYGLSEADWLAGTPRILDDDTNNLTQARLHAISNSQLARSGRLETMQSTICLPVPYQDNVEAVLNLDSFSRPNAFGEDSLDTLKHFRAPVAGMLSTAHHRDEILHAAAIDPVTGVLNRHGLETQLKRTLALAKRNGAPFTLLLMDIAGFKTINDAFGHMRGDEVLRHVGRTLDEQCREEDLVARWAGDEFAVLLPGTNLQNAHNAVKRLEDAITFTSVDGHTLRVDTGVASFPDDGNDLAALLQTAEERMYATKASSDPEEDLPAYTRWATPTNA